MLEPVSKPSFCRKHRNRGQAVIELAFTLPFVISLFYYTINSFYSLHTAHVAQKYAAMSLWQRINHRAKFVMDDVERRLHNREFMASRFVEEDGTIPQRKIVRGPTAIVGVVGVCREPGCTQ